MKWKWMLFVTSVWVALPAQAQQSPLIIDAISQTVGKAGGGFPSKCDVNGLQNKPKALAKFNREAEPALQKYLALAATGEDPGPAFKRRPVRIWALDGIQFKQFSTIRDPWASQLSKLELVGMNLGVSDLFGHAVWRAYAKDGSPLGAYDAVTVIASEGHRLVELYLWSPEQAGKIRPVTPFCFRPGDYEAWLAAKSGKP